jgi:hypothetical protein
MRSSVRLIRGVRTSSMTYADGEEAMLGDTISIDEEHRGVVVACIDRGEYSAEHPGDQWAYLKEGVVVKTSFAGLVHYTQSFAEGLALIARAGSNPS